jgi:transcriptional regulator with XRE-family HTH domain
LDATNESKTFAELFRNERESQGVTQKELGEMTGIKRWDISTIESGKMYPTKEQFENICNLFNKNPSYFFPNGVPELREYRKHKKPWQRPLPRKRDIPEDEKNINFDIEDELNPQNEDSKAAVEEELTVKDKSDVYNNIEKLINDFPQIESVISHLIDISSRYLHGAGDPTLDITIAFSDKNGDDFLHRRIVNKSK